MSFWRELRRRNIFRVAFTYGVVAWLLIQVVNNVAAPLALPAWTPTLVIVLLGVGFPVALVLAWALELTPEGVKRSSEAHETAAAPPVFGRKWDFVIIGGLVVALGYFVWGRHVFTEPVGPAMVAETETSLAVLPFENLSSDPEQEFFADGVADTLINALSRIRGLRVAGRTSSFYFKGRDEDARTIAEQLDVEHILAGSVARSRQRVRVTAQLIHAASGHVLFSENYDRALEDIFAIQDEIAGAVGEALEVTLGVGELGRIPGMTRDLAAYEAYLEGGLSLMGTASNFRNRVAALERAVELDPSFAVAQVSLSEAYRLMGTTWEPENASDWYARAEATLARARALTPQAPGLLAVSGLFAAQRGEFLRGVRFLREALGRSGGGYATGGTHFALALQLVQAGKLEEATRHLLEARRIDPLSPDVWNMLGYVYGISGDAERAFETLERGEEIGEGRLGLRGTALWTALATRDEDEIRRRLGRYLALAVDIERSGRPVHAAMRDLLDEPEQALAELRRRLAEPNAPRAAIALWAAYFGDPELALTAHDTGQVWARWYAVFSDVRELPGFKDIVREAGLVEYWRETGWGDFCHPVGESDFECE